MQRGLIAIAVLFGLGALVALSAVFTVHQTQQALVLQFGNPVRVDTQPGLHFKLPLLQQVEYMEKRILNFDAPEQELVAGDNRRLVVDAFARWRITDPLKFYQSVRTEMTARSRLETLIDASVREQLAKTSSDDIVSGARAELMQRIAVDVTRKAEPFGIEIVDVRLRRVDLPKANSESIFARMQAEREREAKEIRAKGNEDAQTIQADADRQVVVLTANAERTAQILRGEGDQKRNAIFADAFSKDPEFFEFYRSMQAYREALKSNSTTMVLDPESPFFRYFNNPNGK